MLKIMYITCLGAQAPLFGLRSAHHTELFVSCFLLHAFAGGCGTQEYAARVKNLACCLQASVAVREFETKDDIRVFLLPHKVGAAGLTLNRGEWPHHHPCAARVCAVL